MIDRRTRRNFIGYRYYFRTSDDQLKECFIGQTNESAAEKEFAALWPGSVWFDRRLEFESKEIKEDGGEKK